MPTSQVGGPQPEFARQGRELQRYGANGERLVAGYGSAASCLVPQLQKTCRAFLRARHEGKSGTLRTAYLALQSNCTKGLGLLWLPVDLPSLDLATT